MTSSGCTLKRSIALRHASNNGPPLYAGTMIEMFEDTLCRS